MSQGFGLNLVFDAVVAVLLVATIVYAAILNRKLSALRGLKAEMETLVTRLAESTRVAEDGLSHLRGTAERSGETMQRTAETARGVADELSFLIERGNSLARRLDGAPPSPAANASAPPAAPSTAPPAAAPVAEPASSARPATRPATGNRRAKAPSGAPAAEPAPSPQEAALLKALQGLR